MIQKLWIVSLLALVFAGCSQTEGTGASITIPSVQLSCNTSKCTSVMGTRLGVVILSLSGCDVDTVESRLVATGSVNAVCNGSTCDGVITSWQDANSVNITTIASGNYYICSRIDINNNGIRDAADEFSELYDPVVSSTVKTITSWGASALVDIL